MRIPIGSQREDLSTFKTNIIRYCLYIDPKMTSSATWMDLEISNQMKPDRKRQIYDITYIWNQKKPTYNELIYKTEIDPWT